MIEKDKQEIIYLITNYIPATRALHTNLLKHISKKLKTNKCYLRHGSFKMVLISKKIISDFVIKIPFNYIYNQDEDKFIKMENDIDYCLSEYEVFKKMKEMELDCFFAKTSYFGNVKNIPIYLQEKVITYDDMSFCCTTANYEDLKKICQEIATQLDYDFNELLEELLTIPLDWWTKSIEFYGENKVSNFIKLIGENDIDMSCIWGDLHDGNFGFRNSDLSPCLLDFSGYSHTGYS